MQQHIRITSMPGGGTSWRYLMVGGKCHGSAKVDDKEGMAKLVKEEKRLIKEFKEQHK
jgi:hypothetical protein